MAARRPAYAGRDGRICHPAFEFLPSNVGRTETVKAVAPGQVPSGLTFIQPPAPGTS
jgi:hypothetical protein